MKKIIAILFLTLTFVLIGCTEEKPKKNTTSDDLIISKYFETEDLYENAIEIFNPLSLDVDLSTYKLDIYSNGDVFVTNSIQLTGTLKANEYLVIAHDNVTNETLKNNADILSSDLSFNGNDTIVLSKENQTIDILGMIGSSVVFAKDVTLIRKERATKANSVYVAYDFIMYLPELYKYLKNNNHPIKTDKDMLDGPTTKDDLLFLPFVDPNNPNLGGGGIIKVTVSRLKDGDTTDFVDSLGNIYTMRYNLVDTREVDGTVIAQEWGYPASNYTNNILRNAKDIYIQSVKGAQLKDNYNRYLGYVWADGQLMSFEIVKAGMSEMNFDFDNVTEGDLSQTSIEIPYFSYVYNAALRAQNNKWGVHGEVDPNWNYDTKKPTDTRNYLPPARPYNPEIDN